MNKKISQGSKTLESEGAIHRILEPSFSQPIYSPLDHSLFLQRVIGNQGIQRLSEYDHIQAKLRVSHPNDKYEQEADRVTEQVMQMPKPQLQ